MSLALYQPPSSRAVEVLRLPGGLHRRRPVDRQGRPGGRSVRTGRLRTRARLRVVHL